MSNQGEDPVAVLLAELGKVLDPLAAAFDPNEPGDFTEFLDDAGLGELLVGQEVSKTEQALEPAVTSFLATYQDLQAGNLDLATESDREQLTSTAQAVYGAVKSVDDLSYQDPDVEELGDRLLDHLLVTYLWDHHRDVYSVLTLFGVVVERPDAPTDLELSAFGDVVSNPRQQAVEALGWGSEQEAFLGLVVLGSLKELCWELGVPATMERPDASQVETLADAAIDDLAVADAEALDPTLRIPAVTHSEGGTNFMAGLSVRTLPGDGQGTLPGLALVPVGNFSAGDSWTLDDDGTWTFGVEASGKLTDYGFTARPTTSGAVETAIRPLDGGSTPAELRGEAELAYDASAASSGSETTLVGNPEGSRLALSGLSVRSMATFDDSGGAVGVELPATGTIGAHPDDFDNFLEKVLPADGLFYDFDATVGWTSTDGLFFERGGTLETSIPQNASLGPVTLNEIYLALTPDGQTVTLEGAASATLEIGPVTGTVKRMGVEAEVAFPPDGDGELGPIEFERVGFRPPDGIGLEIDAGAVSGGGYLELDHENDRYAGVVQLRANDLTITAVGLLTTDLPGSDDGYSLLILIAGEFPPVDLGMGFTLNGVGGLVGLHRSLKVDPLRKAVRSGSMDQVLFPENPVANGPEIVSRLRSTFPPTKDHHVFGPMAKIGWGTPENLVVFDLGIVLELPTWKVALLGRISAELPEDEPMVVLNMDVLGVLRPQQKRAAIDATIYDSRVAQWSISGDMAMRARWGDDSRFVLSVGGFHPRFDPPDDFPSLRRVRIGLGDPSGNPSIELKSYFAVTSNTFQVGAAANLAFEAGPASISGHLGFDALFRFNPFEFVVDFGASLTVEAWGFTVDASIDGTLSGPTPYRVEGEAHVELSKLKTVDESFNVTLGPTQGSAQLPKADVLSQVVEALDTPENWTAQRPPGGEQVVTVRRIEPEPDQVLAHPLGRVATRQTVVPLGDFHVEKFGNARPAPHDRFAIVDADTGGDSSIALSGTLEEEFAPAQFTKMSDAEKLDSPAFESHVAGRRVRPEGVFAGWYGDANSPDEAENTRTTTLTYEATYVDETNDQPSSPPVTAAGYSQDVLATLVGAGAVANADARTTGEARFELSDDEFERLHLDEDPSGPRADDDGPRATAVEARSRPSAPGARRAATDGGADRSTVPGENALAAKLTSSDPEYVIVRTDDMTVARLATAPRDGTMSKVEARRALERHLDANPEDAGAYRVAAAQKARNARVAAVAAEPAGTAEPTELDPDVDAAVEEFAAHVEVSGEAEPDGVAATAGADGRGAGAVEPHAEEPAVEDEDSAVASDAPTDAKPPATDPAPANRVDGLLWSVERHCRTVDDRLAAIEAALDGDDPERARAIVEEQPTPRAYAGAVGRHTFDPLARGLLKLVAEPRSSTRRESFSRERLEDDLGRLRDDWTVLLATVEAVEGDLRSSGGSASPTSDLREARDAVARMLDVVERLRAALATAGADRADPAGTDREDPASADGRAAGPGEPGAAPDPGIDEPATDREDPR